MSHARTPHKQWCEEHTIEDEPYGLDEVIFCEPEAREHEAVVLIENRAGLVPR